MDIREADEIVDITFGTDEIRASRIEGIKAFRRATSMGLYEAKQYIELYPEREKLRAALYYEFVTSKTELLARLVAGRDLLNRQIADLEEEIQFDETAYLAQEQTDG